MLKETGNRERRTSCHVTVPFVYASYTKVHLHSRDILAACDGHGGGLGRAHVEIGSMTHAKQLARSELLRISHQSINYLIALAHQKGPSSECCA